MINPRSGSQHVQLLSTITVHCLSLPLSCSICGVLRNTHFTVQHRVIINCNNNLLFKNVTHLEISCLKINGQVRLSKYVVRRTKWLRYTSHTAQLKNVSIEGIRLLSVGNSTSNHCTLNNSALYISCSWYTPNDTNSMTLYTSKTLNSEVMEGGLVNGIVCKDLKLTIIECTIDNDHERK